MTDTHDADGLDPDMVEEVVGPVKRVAGKTWPFIDMMKRVAVIVGEL